MEVHDAAIRKSLAISIVNPYLDPVRSAIYFGHE
jgi:hypothetical protein